MEDPKVELFGLTYVDLVGQPKRYCGISPVVLMDNGHDSYNKFFDISVKANMYDMSFVVQVMSSCEMKIDSPEGCTIIAGGLPAPQISFRAGSGQDVFIKLNNVFKKSSTSKQSK